MKKIIFISLISLQCFSQTKQPDTDFYLDNNKMYWEHIYEVPKNNINELVRYFEKEVLTNIKQDNFKLLENTISFNIADDKVNFKKYGGSQMGTAFIAQLYMNYLVVIDFKENKYKVIVKEIFLDNKLFGMGQMSGDISEFCTKKNVTEFKTNSVILNGLIYDHKHFLEKFTIQESTKKDW